MKNKTMRIASLAILAAIVAITFGPLAVLAETVADSSSPEVTKDAANQNVSEGISAPLESAPSTVSSSQSLEDRLIVPWNEMNLRFRESYAKNRRGKIDKLGPVAIFREDKLILRYRGKREEFVIIPQQFTLLKSVSHIPLAIFVMLEDKAGSRLDEDSIKTLTVYAESIDKAASNIDKWKLSASSLARQHQIIDAGKAMIDRIVKSGTVNGDELQRFTREMGPLVLENAYESLALQLDVIDGRLKTWKEGISPEDWKRLRVAVMAPHMPREENSTVQYLQKMLKQNYEGEGIIYGEGKNEEDFAMDLIGTHVLDRQVAINFFKDPWRMHRDLLADAAKRYLKSHRPLQ